MIRRRGRMVAVAAGLIAAATAAPAAAEFRFCNRTEYVISAAIGYRDGGDWVSRGWWLLLPGQCHRLVDGDLRARYFYTYAHSQGRTTEEPERLWSGEFYLCTRPDAFAIRGVDSCQERGYERRGFQEVDVDGRTAWTTTFASPPDWPSLEAARIAGVQRLLTLLGHDAGSVDGAGGPRTRRAIEDFQERAGLPVDGEATAELLERLVAAFPDRPYNPETVQRFGREMAAPPDRAEPPAQPPPDLLPGPHGESPALLPPDRSILMPRDPADLLPRLGR